MRFMRVPNTLAASAQLQFSTSQVSSGPLRAASAAICDWVGFDENTL
jgi:hypothetical protein